MGGTVETQGVVSERGVHGCCGCIEPAKLTCASTTKCCLKSCLLLTFILGMKKILEEFFCRLMTEKTCGEIEAQGGYIIAILGFKNTLRYCEERNRNICFGVNCKFGMTCLNQDFHSGNTDDDDNASDDDDSDDYYYDDDNDDINPISPTQRTNIKFQTYPYYHFVLQDLSLGFNYKISFGTHELDNLEFHERFLPELDNIFIHLDSKEPIYSTLSNNSHNSNQNIEIGLGFNQFENSDFDESFIKGSHSTRNSNSFDVDPLMLPGEDSDIDVNRMGQYTKHCEELSKKGNNNTVSHSQDQQRHSILSKNTNHMEDSLFQNFGTESDDNNFFSNEGNLRNGIGNSTSDYSCPAPCRCPEENDVITDKFSLEDDVVCENKCPLNSEHDPMKPCLAEPLSRDLNLSSPTKGKKKHFLVRDTELDRSLRISKKSLKISKQFGISLVDYIAKRPEMIRSIVKQMIPILKTQKTLDSKFVKDNLAPLRLYGSHMSKPVETQVNFLEARAHPHTVNGIPWKYLNDERFRLMSFVKFPRSSPLSTIKLASKGFAYLDLDSNSNGAILCFFCSAQIEVANNEDHIDEEHKRLGVNCPKVKNARCSNISMESQRPKMTAGEIFSQLYAYRNNEKEVTQSSASAPARPSKNQTAGSNSNNVRPSQPSDESTSYVIVTNTSDLAESDALLQNGGHTVQSSQSIGDSRSPRDQQDQLSVIASSQNPGSADVSSTGDSDNNNDTVQTTSEVESTTGQEGNTQQEQSDEGQNSTGDNGGDAHSYEKLGIITARPKRLEYAVYETRLSSFAEWPGDSHMKPEDLAKAGHYYTGYSDCARCFFCGGGMRNWEPEDSVWVEHARWFPKCAYLLQEVGKDFVATVQEMNSEIEIAEIRYDDVIQRMQDSTVPTPLNFKLRNIERDPAVLTVIDNGFDENKIFELALEFRNTGETLSSDKLYEVAINRKIPKSDASNNLGSDSISVRKEGNQKRDEETIKTLRNENITLRQQTTCKICMDNDISVVFLPCRHLVSCTDCSFTLSACPVCRDHIKGTVRAYI